MKEKLLNFIAEYCKLDQSKIKEDSHVVLDLGLASFDVIELCAALELEFEISISDSEMFELERVGDIITCIENKKTDV